MTLASRSAQLIVSRQQCSHRVLQAALSGCILRGYSGAQLQLSTAQQYSTADPSKPLIIAACVLERLPIVKSPPPIWETEYKAWTQLRKQREGQTKQYPQLEKKQKSTKEEGEQRQQESEAFPTKADYDGRTNTMRRRLADKLVLLVRTQQAAASAGQQAAGAALSNSAIWTFPQTVHQEGETTRQAAERALKEAIGPSQVYFVGNAPMAHLDIRYSSPDATSSSGSTHADSSSNAEVSSSSQQHASNSSAGSSRALPSTSSSSSSRRQRPDARIFFHLAHVVNDPWDVKLFGDAVSEFAWVSVDELLRYIEDNRLVALAQKML